MSDVSDPFRDFEYLGWQRAARQYDGGFGSITSQAVDPLLDAAGAGPGVRLLDVACGPGYVAAAAEKRGSDVLGLDFSSEMIAFARERYPALTFEEGDAERLELPDERFDAVVMNFGMLHLGRPERAIAEAFRVLHRGGRYAFTVWDLPERAVAFNIVLQSIQAYGELDVGLPAGPPFFRFSDPREAERALTEAGFTGVGSVQVPQTWVLDSGEALFTTMLTASVRTAALLNMQRPEALVSIRKEIASRAEEFRKGPVIELPMPAILTSAYKPFS